jgi:hypothetical protein
LEATFRDRVTRRMAKSPARTGTPGIIGAELPADADERLRALRSPVTRELRPAPYSGLNPIASKAGAISGFDMNSFQMSPDR